MFVKNNVFSNLLHDLVLLHRFASELAGFGIADFGGFPTFAARIPNCQEANVRLSDHLVLALAETVTSTNATILPRSGCGKGRSIPGCGTICAGGDSHSETRSADPRAVIHGEPLYVEDQSLHFICLNSAGEEEISNSLTKIDCIKVQRKLSRINPISPSKPPPANLNTRTLHPTGFRVKHLVHEPDFA
jgi:hypothetical protein